MSGQIDVKRLALLASRTERAMEAAAELRGLYDFVSFDRAEAESLAVVDKADSRRVIGVLTEAHALRRYAEETDRHRRHSIGEA